MKLSDRVWRRLRKDRPMISVTLRMPTDVVDDLKDVAPVLGFSGYQPLIRAYIGRGLREDLARLDEQDSGALLESLRKRGVDEKTLAAAMAEVARRR
jgi:hypothetical protein